MPVTTALLWYRRDLRVADHPALTRALRDAGIQALPQGGSYVVDVSRPRTQGGTPFVVFSPFHRHWLGLERRTGYPLVDAGCSIPCSSSARFDPDGDYVRAWVPELRDVPLERLVEPLMMSDEEQAAAGCVIGEDYPAPIVDHG